MAGVYLKEKYMRLVVNTLMCLCIYASVISAQNRDLPEIFVQLGHSERITQIEYTPDGKYIVSAGDDKILKIWDAVTGRELRTLSGHTSESIHFAILPGLKSIISGGLENRLYIWDFESGILLRTIDLRPNSSCVYDISVSPDGQFAAVAIYAQDTEDNRIEIYHIQTGTMTRSLSGYQDMIRSVRFSPDGKYIAGGGGGWENFENEPSKDNSICIWDIKKGHITRQFNGHRHRVNSVRFSDDGKRIISASLDSTVRIWNMQAGKAEKEFFARSAVNDAAFAPDGKHMICAGDQDEIRIWDLITDRDITAVRGEESFDSFISLSFSEDGRKIAFCKSNSITVRDYGLNVLAALGGNVDVPTETIFSTDRMIVFYGRSRNAFRYDRLTGRLSDQFVYDSYDETFHFAGGRLFDKRDPDHIIDVADDLPWGLKVSPYGPYAVNSTEKNICNVDNFQSCTNIEGAIKSYCDEIAFSPDGKYFAAVISDEGLSFALWDVRSGKQIRQFNGHTSLIIGMTFTSDSRFIVTGSLDKTIRIWNVETGEMLRTLEGHSEPVYSVAVSRDSRYILSASWDLTIRLWDFQSGKNTKTLLGHKNTITRLSISADNSMALSGSYDGTMRLWDLHTAQELAQFIHFRDGEWIIITPGGEYMSSVNGDKYLNVRVGNQVYGIDQYRTVFYRPTIIENIIKSGRPALNDDPSKGYDLIKYEPPFIVMKYPEEGSTVSSLKGELSVYIEDRNQAIKKVTVYINGRTAGTAETRGMKVSQGVIDIDDGKKSVDLKIPVTLDPGDNLIQVVATNGFSEGRKSIKIRAEDKSVSLKSESILPNLWILGIGINQYQDKKLPSLSYAVADASGIIETFASQKGKLFRDVHSMMISDIAEVKPTYENIIDNLHYLKKAGANDVAVLFIAGHGLNDEGGEFYFLPNDAVLLDDGSIKRSRAISWREIRSILDFPGKKIVFVDACHSEGVSGKKTRSVDTHRFVKELQDANAVIFTSSRGNQLSQESKEWGHGAFSYAIIQGLKGKANLIKDNKISMKELDTYVSETVPLLTNGAQHPITSTPDGYVNFPVAIIE